MMAAALDSRLLRAYSLLAAMDSSKQGNSRTPLPTVSNQSGNESIGRGVSCRLLDRIGKHLQLPGLKVSPALRALADKVISNQWVSNQSQSPITNH